MIKKRFAQFALFFHHAAEKGILLLSATVAALVIANSYYSESYHNLLETTLSISLGASDLKLSLHAWVNDLLMAVFFFLVGMEIKREMLEGNLASRDQKMLPIIAACFGVMVPVIIYCFFNIGDPIRIRGWAIPSATDIAFALGMLSLFGSWIPISLKVFLTALAIIDDLIAVVLIAFFYTEQIEMYFLFYIVVIICVVGFLNKAKIVSVPLYVMFGLLLWYCFLRSGVHATIAGVTLGMLVPLYHPTKKNFSPLKFFERAIHPLVAYLILPIFAFTNSGLDLSGISVSTFANPVALGIILGLFLGKQLGIFFIVSCLIKFKICNMPQKATYLQLYGVSVLCGIGFTMSFFIGNIGLGNHLEYLNEVQLGVLTGSLLSSVYGAIILKISQVIKK
jgi:NhaA family Na+:H+ antiporter